MKASTVTIKTEQDLEKLRVSGRLAAEVLAMIGAYVKPGVTTEYLDDICNDYIVNTLKVIPANVGYYGYTKTTCISPNEVLYYMLVNRATLGDIGHAIQSVGQREGYSIVREYCGHGIGKIYHEQPNVLHYGKPGQGLVLKQGMVFTIEPMINAGKASVKELKDGWTVVTADKSLSAQWEHMVAVTETGFELLTPWPEGTGNYPEI
ncbi:hypothetical protein FQR65_LT16326 [Abscondita terminalis]|nr:hypothetical protein FQR65_LT16326 [Abscondita terminalis]